MSPDQIQAYVLAGSILVAFGQATVESVRSMFGEAVKSEAELNAICAGVAADATRRKALADADAGTDPNA